MHAPRLRGAAALILTLCALAAPAAAQAAPTWQDGVSRSSVITNCASVIFGNPYQETGASSYVGFYADPNDLPDTGQVYYVHTVFVALGNSCSGQYGYPELSLPPGTQLAISQATPVFCYALDFTQSQPSATRDTTDCPQQPSGAFYGGTYGFGCTTCSQQGGAWPMPQGKGWEIQVPVVSSQSLRGTAASPCDCLRGFTKMLDGNGSPVLQPSQGVFVEAAPPPQDPGGGTTGGGTTGGDPAGGGTPTGDTGGGGTPTGDTGGGTTTTTPHPDMPGSSMTPGEPPADGGGTGDGSGTAPKLARPRVASRFSLRRFLSRGLRFTVTVDSAGTAVDASLTARVRGRRTQLVLAHGSRHRTRAGRLVLKLKPTRREARRLRRARVLRATLHVTVMAPSGMPHMLPPQRVTLRR